jgi:putative transposase
MKRTNAQKIFVQKEFKEKLCFGGRLLTKSANRHARPVSTKETMHLVLKSSKAKGRYSFRSGQNAARVKSIIESQCAKFGVKLIRFSNNFNHLHLHTKFPSRVIYVMFIKSLTAKLTLAVTGASKARPIKSIFGAKGFWDHRPFSRVVKGFRAFNILNDYIRLNQLEAEGAIPHRDGRLRDLELFERLEHFET